MSARPITLRRGGVTAPQGFLAAGIHAGLKPPPHLDLALVVSECEGPVAGMLTRNRVPAAPVVIDRIHLRHGTGRAILINSGHANACTGKPGLRDAMEMAETVSARLGIPRRSVFVSSTGVIGLPLPMALIKRGIPRLIKRLRPNGGAEAARAILTTDLKTKEVAVQGRIGHRLVTLGGMAKGAGMIHPDLATMLAYLTTDAAITRTALRQALRAAVQESFNCITIDGDTSTNDTVLCLANGRAGNEVVRPGTAEWTAFQHLLTCACRDLALQICRDGEGVTKVVQIVVKGARTGADARRVARTIGTSVLVKTALFGQDANWGRLVAAAGRSAVALDPARLDLCFDDVPIVRRGVTLGRLAERKIARVITRKEFSITLDLRLGRGRARVWTTDLSYDYVRINASYRT